MTTWQRIEPLLRGVKAKQRTADGQQYVCLSPFRDEKHPSFGIVVKDDGEHGGWIDRASSASGSLYELARYLGIEPEGETRHTAAHTKRTYDGLADYAAAHGGTVEAFAKAGWTEATFNGRAALRYPTGGGERVRFLDGNEPRYIWAQSGAKTCWYGLKRVPQLMKDSFAMPLPVLCNGEASTIVAQSVGIPAFCSTGGEGGIGAGLIDELVATLQDTGTDVLVVALDCDKAGRTAAVKIAEALSGRLTVLIVDLGFTDGGDLADWCKLYGDESAMRLAQLASTAHDRQQRLAAQQLWETERRSATLASGLQTQRTALRTPIGAPPIIFPFKTFHQFGGFTRVLSPKKINAVIGTSGGMKTSLLECFNDVHRAQGIHSLWYGREWTEDEMAARAIERFGGASWTAQRLHQVWLHEDAAGVPLDQRQGVKLSDGLIEYTEAVIDSLAQLPGQLAFLAPQAPDVVTVLAEASNRLDELDRQGKRPRLAFFDYLQLIAATAKVTGSTAAQSVVDEIKLWTEFCQQVTWCASQSNKHDSRMVRDGGGKLDADSMNYVRSDAFNLLISIKPKWNEDGTSAGYGEVVITKQNDGKSGKAGEFLLALDAGRRRWKDEQIFLVTHDMNNLPTPDPVDAWRGEFDIENV